MPLLNFYIPLFIFFPSPYLWTLTYVLLTNYLCALCGLFIHLQYLGLCLWNAVECMSSGGGIRNCQWLFLSPTQWRRVYTFITHIACLSSMIWHTICCVNREVAKVCSAVDKVTCPCLWVNSKDSQRTCNPISNDAGFTAVAFVG